MTASAWAQEEAELPTRIVYRDEETQTTMDEPSRLYFEETTDLKLQISAL